MFGQAPLATLQIPLADESATLRLGALLARHCGAGCMLHLHGPLGAGKTTLSRGALRGFGHAGTVKSPTDPLVEPYELQGRIIYHFDLYRLADPEELEFMGMRDYLRAAHCCLIEWPEKGAPLLPAPDLSITLTPEPAEGRLAIVQAQTARAQTWLAAIAAAL